MNIKKFVSAVSALTMAVSAFAGMATVASAEETATTAFSQDFTAVVPEGETEASTNPQDYGFKALSGLAVGNSSYTVADGKLTIVAQSDHGNSRGYEFAADFDAISYGIVNISYKWEPGAATGHATKSYSETYIADASGAKIFALQLRGADSYYGGLYLNGTYVATMGRNKTATVNATIDLTQKKIMSLSVGSFYSIESPISITATSVARFGFAHASGAKNWSNTSSVDDVSITYVAPKVAALTTYLSYKANGEEIGNVSLDVDTSYVGDTIYYGIPKYIIKDGSLYEATQLGASYYATKYVIAAPGEDESDVTIDIEYNKVNAPNDGIPVYFGDFGTLSQTPNTSSTDYQRASGGAWGNPSLLVPSDTLEDGVYTLTLVNNRNRKAVVNVGGTPIGSLATGANAGSVNTTVFENVVVTGGAEITLTKADGAGAVDNVDYILVTRTGSLVKSENLGAFEGTDGSTATAFKADLTGVTGKLNMTITSSEGEAKDFEGFTTLSDANVILGIIAENLKDAAATAVITVQ